MFIDRSQSITAVKQNEKNNNTPQQQYNNKHEEKLNEKKWILRGVPFSLIYFYIQTLCLHICNEEIQITLCIYGLLCYFVELKVPTDNFKDSVHVTLGKKEETSNRSLICSKEKNVFFAFHA